MPISNSKKHVRVSPRQQRAIIQQKKLDTIAQRIDLTKLPDKPSIPVDPFGRVTIQPDHPDFDYFTKEDDE
jgi:hypothetical protein